MMYYPHHIQPYVFQIINEMNFWLSLSREHPLFIKRMAQCQNISIPRERKNDLNKHFTDFKELSKDIQSIQKQCSAYFYTPSYMGKCLSDVSAILHKIMKVDVAFLHTLKKLEDLPAKDSSWQVFINHIALEQRQLLQTCSTYSIQLKSLGY